MGKYVGNNCWVALPNFPFEIKGPPCALCSGDYTTQLYRDYNAPYKPLKVKRE